MKFKLREFLQKLSLCLKTKVSVIIKDIQFVTVGVLEQLDVSLSVMECLMTDFMKVLLKDLLNKI